MDIDETNDFGFTTFAEIERSTAAKEIADLIMPLLENLAKDGDKNPIINWPMREERINKIIDQINLILNSELNT